MEVLAKQVSRIAMLLFSLSLLVLSIIVLNWLTHSAMWKVIDKQQEQINALQKQLSHEQHP